MLSEKYEALRSVASKLHQHVTAQPSYEPVAKLREELRQLQNGTFIFLR